ncbi:MAG: FtsX-like permease family protein [Microthrixaceae bacterium]
MTVVEGRAAADGEIALDRGTVEDRHFRVGSRLSLATGSGRREVTVVGVTQMGSLRSGMNGGTASAVPAFANVLAGPGAKLSNLLVAGTGAEATLAGAVQRVLPVGLVAHTGTWYRNEQKDQFKSITDVLRPVIQGFSALAIFICAFVIANTFTVVVTQRTRELALMRAVAATPLQIRRSLRIEGLGVGLLGSVLGIGFGTALTAGLASLLGHTAKDLPPASIHLTPGVVITGMLVGTIVTFLAVLVPAFRAGRTAPVAAMRASAVETTRPNRFRMGLAAVLVAGGLVGLVVPKALAVGIGAFAFTIGIIAAGPVLALGFARLCRPVTRRFGVSARLSTDNLARNPKRTSTTTNALVIGLLLVTLVTVAGNSLKRYSVKTVSDHTAADFIMLTSAGSVPETILADARRLEGVTAFAPLSSTTVKVDGHGFGLTSTDLGQLQRIFRLKAGSLENLGLDGVATPAFDTTNRLGVTKIYTDAFGREYPLTTKALFDFNLDLFTTGAFVSPELMERIAPGTGVTGALVKADPGQRAEVGRSLRRITHDQGNIVVLRGSFFATFIERIFDFLITAVTTLLGMSVIIALIGIVNTLTLSIFERRRELGLLRAVGSTTRDVRRMVRWEALQMALLGTIVGIASGLILGYFLIRASDLGGLQVQWGRLGILLGVGVALGLVASLLPTRRVSKVGILDAIAAE